MDNGSGNVPFRRLAFQDVNVTKVGSQAWLREQYGLGVQDVVKAVKDIVK
jgi:transketolase C-terminal domain/subunit